ncbi:MAG: RNA polymerase sigma factor [bacterium]|nr:RNA polymerase sigma factor [bacterium]
MFHDPAMNKIEDKQLVRSIAEGDEAAFEEILRRYHKKIINFIYYFTRDANHSEDIAQDVFIKVWKNAAKFKGNSTFATWLYRVVVNTCLNYCRSKKSTEKHVETCADPESVKGGTVSTGNNFSSTERTEREYLVHRALDQLPPLQKTTLILSRFEGYSYAEISELTDLSVSAVQSHLFRAKQNVARFLTPFKKKGEI